MKVFISPLWLVQHSELCRTVYGLLLDPRSHCSETRHNPGFGIAPQIMRCNMLQARSLAAGLDDIPHNILRDAFAPHLSRRPGDGSKDPSLRDPGCSYPLIERCFDPIWNRNCADVAALADQIHYCPVPLPHLD